jgi:tripartite-type tricarboxylate transporter receptor subunit TctC
VRAIFAMFAIWCGFSVNCDSLLAEEWPTRPVKIVLAYSAGGGIDIGARELARRLSESFGQSFYVENRPGASGNTGTDYVAKAAPDGYTLLFGSDIQFTIMPNLDKSLPYKVSDFAPISMIADMGLILVAHSSLPANSVPELIALAKTRPGKINYGSSGPGTTHELAMEMLQQRGGFKLTEVPYRGTGQALPDLLSGQIQVMFAGIAERLPYLRNGQLKALGAGGAKRFENLPDVPTIAEQGFPGFAASIPAALYAPAGTPPPIIAKLQQQVALILSSKDMRDRFLAIGGIAMASTPEALTAHLEEDSAKWVGIIHEMREHSAP